MRDAALGEGPAGKDLGVIGRARAGTDGAHGPVRLVTAWDRHAAPAGESSAQPSCCVRVIKALDRGSGRYIVKEGVSWKGRSWVALSGRALHAYDCGHGGYGRVLHHARGGLRRGLANAQCNSEPLLGFALLWKQYAPLLRACEFRAVACARSSCISERLGDCASACVVGAG